MFLFKVRLPAGGRAGERESVCELRTLAACKLAGSWDKACALSSHYSRAPRECADGADGPNRLCFINI